MKLEELDRFFYELNQINKKQTTNSKQSKPRITKKINNNMKIDLKKANEVIQKFNNSAFYKEPTFFEITKFPHSEIVYSNILAFYFNIKKEHNFGDLILRALLKSADIQIKEIKQLNVYTEYYTNNGNRIDLVLYSDNFVIGIENKINATIYNDLKDYADTLNKINSNCYKIILSLKDESTVANENGYINVTYSNFINNIRLFTKDVWDGNNKWHILLEEVMTTIENMKGDV